MSKNKTKTKTSQTDFHFWIFFFSSSTKYPCKSENPSFGDSVVAILNRDPKLFDSIDFSTLYSRVLDWKKRVPCMQPKSKNHQ